MTRPDPAKHKRRLGLLLAGIGSLAATIGAFVFFRKPATNSAEDEGSGRGSPGTPPSPSAQSSGHETEDMNGRRMMWVLCGLGGLAASCIMLMILLLGYFHQWHDAGVPRFTAEQIRTVQAPRPNLQSDPDRDLARLHRDEDRLLEHYAWVDASHARARIPIRRAVALTIGQTLDGAP